MAAETGFLTEIRIADIFERTMGIPPEGRYDPSVRDRVVEVMSEAVASAPEGRELNDDFWLSYSIGALWIYLNDPDRAEDHGVCVLDELVTEGVARLVVRNMEDEVTFGVVANAQSVPESLRYLN